MYEIYWNVCSLKTNFFYLMAQIINTINGRQKYYKFDIKLHNIIIL